MLVCTWQIIASNEKNELTLLYLFEGKYETLEFKLVVGFRLVKIGGKLSYYMTFLYFGSDTLLKRCLLGLK